MYAAHFGLREPPFSITPDPTYVYLSHHHREALAHLLYGTAENGGFVQLTGEVGTGKTTLVRTLLEQELDQVDIALCLNPRLTVEELLATVCDELSIPYPREHQGIKLLVDALNAHLLRTHAAGRRTVLIIDEAQNLSREVLEQIRLLTNLETTKHKLLRIILVGQPELRQLLARPDLRQLSQRITARYHLRPLDRRDTAAYIRHRLWVAGGSEALLSNGALRVAYHSSGGVPRLINIICDRALLGAYSQNARWVGARLIRHAARETLQGSSNGSGRRLLPLWLTLGLGLAGFTAIGLLLWQLHDAAGPAVRYPFSQSATPSPTEQTAAPSSVIAAAAVNDSDLSTLSAWLRGLASDQAYEQLAAVWGVTQPFTGKAQFCEQIKAHALRCLSGRGNWDELRRLNHPAVLRLTPADGAPVTVLLRTLTRDQATLTVADKTKTVALKLLMPLWTGDFLLLWRPPLALKVVGPGNTGEAVRWLRQRLAMAAGQPAPEIGSVTFDAALAAQLRVFQQAQGLQPDGIAGERTLVLLDNLAPSPNTPLLSLSPRNP